MIRIHVGQLDIDEQDELVFSLLLTFADTRIDDALSFLSKLGKTCHLFSNNVCLFDWCLTALSAQQGYIVS